MISNSIAKHVSEIIGVVFLCFSDNIIAQIPINGTAVLEPYDYVIIHVGTNGIGDGAPYQSIISDYGIRIGIIRHNKRGININMSAIIPRPRDNAISGPFIRKVNQYLHEYEHVH